jgi:hypothetical protein
VYLFGALCCQFDSRYHLGFFVGSIASQVLLSVSHPWGVESHYHHVFFVGTPVCAVPVARVTSDHFSFKSHWLQLKSKVQVFSVAIAVARESHGAN